MNILIIGSGGREHALAWKTAQSDKISKVFVAPGNPGTALENKVENIAISVGELEKLADFATDNNVALTIVGPEAPLVDGIVDLFQSRDLKIFGPSQGAAQLEGSKAFSKNFLAKYAIPTAQYGVFTKIEPATDYIKQKGAPIVVKADGLAAGKGVILAKTEAEAIDAVKGMLSGNEFGEAGHRVVIEEFLEGEEASFICIVDGDYCLPMASSQDHKARDEGDKGPNTGGMGAYSPAPVITEAMHNKIMDQVIKPTVEGMKSEGYPFTGFLYAGIMVSKDGIPKVLEFNVRFGDPETQPIMMRLDSDLVDLCMAAVDKKLNQATASWNPATAIGIVLAAEGYPADYRKLAQISGIEQAEQKNCKVFHAGTTLDNGVLKTSGGRVLCVTALGDNIQAAQKQVYQGVDEIKWQGSFYRNDIGNKAINR